SDAPPRHAAHSDRSTGNHAAACPGRYESATDGHLESASAVASTQEKTRPGYATRRIPAETSILGKSICRSNVTFPGLDVSCTDETISCRVLHLACRRSSIRSRTGSPLSHRPAVHSHRRRHGLHLSARLRGRLGSSIQPSDTLLRQLPVLRSRGPCKPLCPVWRGRLRGHEVHALDPTGGGGPLAALQPVL